MTSAMVMFDVELPGRGQIRWGERLDDLAAHLPERCTITRTQHGGRSEFQPGRCAKRSAVITTDGRVCGYEAVAQLNFRSGHLCAVHFHFPDAQPGDAEEFCALVDCIRRRLTRLWGEPAQETHCGARVTLVCKWQDGGLHVEMRAGMDDDHELTLLVNDPSSCPWCA